MRLEGIVGWSIGACDPKRTEELHVVLYETLRAYQEDKYVSLTYLL